MLGDFSSLPAQNKWRAGKEHRDSTKGIPSEEMTILKTTLV